MEDAQYERLDALLGKDRFLGSDESVSRQLLFGVTQRFQWPKLEFDNPDETQDADNAVLLLTLAPDSEINHCFWDDHHWGIWGHRNDLAAGHFSDISIIEEL
ncbi:MAG: YwqG family protein [Rhodobacteraceae bacterium]|nr:YwqG family protein [Paracoccaceae bacterium]